MINILSSVTALQRNQRKEQGGTHVNARCWSLPSPEQYFEELMNDGHDLTPCEKSPMTGVVPLRPEAVNAFIRN